MKQLLTDIKTRLTQVAELKYIDTDWGQLDIPNPPVKFPCALVDIMQGSFSDQAHGSQTGLLEISVRIAYMPLSPGSTGANTDQQSKALLIFDLIASINSSLHCWHQAGSNYGPLTRTAIRKAKRLDGIREYQVNYRVDLKDSSAVKPVLKATVTSIKIDTSAPQSGE